MKVDKSKWRKATLKDICQIVHGKDHKAVNNPNGTFPIYGSGGLSISGEKKSLEVDEIVIQEEWEEDGSPVWFLDPNGNELYLHTVNIYYH